MATYLVCLTGNNFLMDNGELSKKKRFRSVRLVEAENRHQAEAIARELISSDSRLGNILNEESDPPVILLESIKKVPAMAYDAQNRANSFYWEDEQND